MLVDINIHQNECVQLTRNGDGKTTLTIPLGLLLRAYGLYIENKPRFDEASRKESLQ